ncbi:dihydroorotate dehydrogenase electron transfer subunit [Desulfitispora alkaliphila]|uniref:dihydroorotate dehydrogenase electron transfer subunit n=1 Tax=Desulfitispora alkaliphila TaxID=622674 RepID=UPI003D247802
MWHETVGTIITNEQLTAEDYLMELHCKDIATNAKPGQFVNVACTSGLDPLLRRPISIHQVDKVKGTISLLFKAVGKGTKLLTAKANEQAVKLTGPLGKGFHIPSGEKTLVVGGGMGVAPLYFLINQLCDAGNDVTVVLGVKDGTWQPICNLFENRNCSLYFASEDGSIGQKGLVTDVVKEIIEKESITHLYTCGPEPMMKNVVLLAEGKNIKTQVSMERTMACGVGACLGCTCEKKAGDQVVFKRVCTDGPVFSGDEVIWNG